MPQSIEISGGGLKDAIKIRIDNESYQKPEMNPLHLAMMKQMMSKGPVDKTGVPFTRPTREPYVG